MTVGSLKRLILLLNLAAVAGLCGTAYGFWTHRGSLQEERKWPDFHFKPSSAAGSGAVGQVKNLSMTLGKFPVAPTKTEKVEKEPEVSPIQSVLRNLGEIIGAVVFFGPYDDNGGFQPSITFKLKGGGIRTLARGEAIETQPHPDFGPKFPMPYRYKFVGCERDKDDPSIAYFLFDMKCDETDIQRVKWLGDIEPNEPESADGPTGAQETVIDDDMVVVSERELEKRARERAEARARARAEAETVQPVTPEPEEVRPIPTPGGAPGSLGRVENDTWVASDEGSQYIKDNWKKAVEDAKTTTYRDPKSGKAEGILVTKVRPGSVANKLGIYPDDVILTINARRVTKKSQAIAIVRDELDKRKQNILVVEILRNGRKITKNYDARDPETRRNAKEAFRNR